MRRFRRKGKDEAELGFATADGTAVTRVPGSVRTEMQYLCARLDLQDERIPESIALTSALCGEGVTLISRSLAAVMAEDYRRHTCLVDANWWSFDPRLDEQSPGLAGILQFGLDIDEVLVPTRFAHLSVIPSGTVASNERAMLSTASGKAELLAELCARFDHVIIDLPSVSTSTMAMSFGPIADAVLVVARLRTTRVDQVENAVADLGRANVLGVVLNDEHVAMPKVLQRRLLDA